MELSASHLGLVLVVLHGENPPWFSVGHKSVDGHGGVSFGVPVVSPLLGKLIVPLSFYSTLQLFNTSRYHYSSVNMAIWHTLGLALFAAIGTFLFVPIFTLYNGPCSPLQLGF